MFPECLNQIELNKAKFESVTNNLGKALQLACQNNRIGFKFLMLLHDGDEPNRNMVLAGREFKRIFEF